MTNNEKKEGAVLDKVNYLGWKYEEKQIKSTQARSTH